MAELTAEQVWRILAEVNDPEIPVVSVVDLGIIRAVEVRGDEVQVQMTPTFQGCPAVQVMRKEIENRLLEAGARSVQVTLVHSPPWTSQWISPQGREKLRSFGLAPPPVHQGNIEDALLTITACPYCGSQDTSLTNSFGSTLCRMIFVCNSCRQPFEQFKPL